MRGERSAAFAVQCIVMYTFFLATMARLAAAVYFAPSSSNCQTTTITISARCECACSCSMAAATAYLSLVALCLVTCYLEVENCSILVSNLRLLLFGIATATHTTSHDDTQMVAQVGAAASTKLSSLFRLWRIIVVQVHFSYTCTALPPSCVLLVQLDRESSSHTHTLLYFRV